MYRISSGNVHAVNMMNLSVTSTSCPANVNMPSESSFEGFINEAGDVENFIERHKINCGVIHLMTDYLIDLCHSDHIRWYVVC